MAKAVRYVFVALAVVIATAILLFIAYGIWFYWDMFRNWGNPN
jgi:hypothetical protein